MQKTDVDPDDNVLDSWEDLDDTIPEPKAIASSKKKDPTKETKQNLPAAAASSPSPSIASNKTPATTSAPSEPKIRILKRNPAASAAISAPAAPAPPTKTYEERVQAYNEARKRILGSIDDEVESQLTGAPGRTDTTANTAATS